MNKEKKAPPAGRVRDRQTAYTPEGGGADEFHFTEEELEVTPLDVADYIGGDDETQIYMLRNALASGHAAYIANWLEVLKNDKRAIFSAAAHAQRAADFLSRLQAKESEQAAA